MADKRNMANGNRRMTYEEQRAAREVARSSTRSGRLNATEQTKRKIPLIPIVLALLLMTVVVISLRVCSSAMTINVTVNGLPYSIYGAKTIATAVKESGLPINPGDLISLRGVVLKRGAGEAITAQVNGQDTTDLNYQLHDNDVLVISDGKDIVEDYEVSEEITPHSASISGAGAVHSITPGIDGVMELRTGKQSGEQVRWRDTENIDAVCVKWNPEVGDDKVIALTFEEGPSEEYTADILDILKENDAKATFFAVGSEIEKYNDELLLREYEEGHQIACGTYSCAKERDAAQLPRMSREDLEYQVRHGLEVIGSILEEGQYSNIVRLPGGKITEEYVAAIDGSVTANIGWNVDTGDWLESSKSEVMKILMTLEPGDIVRLHDGGGEHSGTVEALREALPILRERGYRFITLDELLEYPPQR